MSTSNNSYPCLRELMSGWFHQDFDIEGETVPEIIAAFNRSCRKEQQSLLKSEIIEFLEQNQGPLDDEFQQEFNPDIDPRGFASSAREFLEQIFHQLEGA